MAGEEAPESSSSSRGMLVMPILAVAGEPDQKDDSCGCNCNCNSNFECNICLDVAKEPVVTPCGHLFCWPCLYRWIYAQSPSPLSECPVCKGVMKENIITPIYGRGSQVRESTTSPAALPPRPRANRRESLSEQLQTAGVEGDTRVLESVILRLIQNQAARGLPISAARTEMTSVPAAAQQRTTPAVVTEPGSSSRQSGPSEPPTRRRTRRRRPHPH